MRRMCCGIYSGSKMLLCLWQEDTFPSVGNLYFSWEALVSTLAPHQLDLSWQVYHCTQSHPGAVKTASVLHRASLSHQLGGLLVRKHTDTDSLLLELNSKYISLTLKFLNNLHFSTQLLTNLMNYLFVLMSAASLFLLLASTQQAALWQTQEKAGSFVSRSHNFCGYTDQ